MLQTLYSSRILQLNDLTADARSDLSSLPAELQLQVRRKPGPCSCLDGLTPPNLPGCVLH